jgi:acyl-CoA synthetase (AMP-forming)/AMP-acid ligase II
LEKSVFLDINVGHLTELLTGRTLNRREIAFRVAERVEQYQDEGLARGDRVLVCYGNNLEFFIDLLAVWHLGASFVPIDGRLSAFEVENLARAVRPRFILVDSKADNSITTAITAAGAKVITPPRNVSKQAHSVAMPFNSRTRLDDEALILFTSGSTGTPKGVVHTHRSLRARWIALRESLGVQSYDRTLCLLPTHFGHGLICNCLFPWLSGLDLYIAPAFSTDCLMQLGHLIDDHKITFLSSVPSMWGLTLKASKPPQSQSLRRIHCGSAPLGAHLWKQIQEWAGTREVFNAYGITETGSWVAGTTVGDFVPEDGLIGIPWGAVIRILSSREPAAAFDLDSPCKTEETGYVWINTAALMQGYDGQQQLTDEVISGGWFLTGDVGLIDQRGWLYLKGREREEINKGGTKIYPQDIDAVVERFEHTRKVCTFGIADPLYGQNVAMAVVLKNDDAITIRALHGWMKRHLAEFKMPIRWYILDSFPPNARGKISRRAVQESCAQRAPLDLQKILRAQP